MSGAIFADDALLPGGWERDVLLRWDAAGRFTAIGRAGGHPTGVAKAAGPLLPGMPNLHSHAFQRAFAGLTEHRSAAEDSFWSWRKLMYRLAGRLTPELVEAIAAGLYTEMLEAGYTSVCEFQYLHHDIGGTPYADDAAMSRALLRAALTAGIGMTLLPVLYQASGFGAKPPQEDQKRFVRSTDSLLKLVEALRVDAKDQDGTRIGFAPHSLRAVPPAALAAAVAGVRAMDASAPIHVHIAEQLQEVNDCLAWCGQRPVAWLLDHAPVDRHWCLVHATHMDQDEYAAAAASGAVAGLCPSTEANLGDGLFDYSRWRGQGGAWGIGSDSHACVNAAEELMLLEYGQRLSTHQRNVGAEPRQPNVATALTLAAVDGGANAAGRPVHGLAVGQQADFVVLDAGHRALQGLTQATDMLSAHVFASHRASAIEGVWVGGRQRVHAGRHALQRSALDGLVAARKQLLLD